MYIEARATLPIAASQSQFVHGHKNTKDKPERPWVPGAAL